MLIMTCKKRDDGYEMRRETNITVRWMHTPQSTRRREDKEEVTYCSDERRSSCGSLVSSDELD